MKIRQHFRIAVIAASILLPCVSVNAFGHLDVITAPKTLFDRAIEARSTSDIVMDNKIVIAVNAIMAKFGTIKASTEFYGQRLLITGLFDDRKLYKNFLAEVNKVKYIKFLYSYIRYLSKPKQKKWKKAGKIIGWADALLLDTKVGLALVGEREVADVNFRVASDAFSHVYILGRARSKGELKTAMKAARGVESAKKIVNYVVVRL